MLTIPRNPDELHLPVRNLWNGEPCLREQVRADAYLSRTEHGLRIRMRAPLRGDERVPDAPRGRFDTLWEYEAVECFLAGRGGEYVEVEMGPGGHWLVFGFKGARHRTDDFAEMDFGTSFAKDEHAWEASIELPLATLPEPIERANAFMIAAGEFLAYSPVPGKEPDFHQPETFPNAYVA